MTTLSPSQTTHESFLEPDRIVKEFGIQEGARIADFGSGHGYYTIPLARAVGPDGKIYAIDIQKNSLDIIRAKARLEHLLNVELIWGDLEEPEGSKIKESSLDLVIISNILFQSDQKQNILKEAARILKNGATLAIIIYRILGGH